MRILTVLTLCSLLIVSGCSKEPQERAIVLVNAAAVDAPLLERVRAFAERELHVAVRTLEKPKLAGKENTAAGGINFQTLEKAAARGKPEADVIRIVLAELPDEGQHLAVFTERGVAIVNVQPLYTEDSEVFARRVERQVMRAAAFSVGLPPTPDPFCVTRDYRSLDDLDRMGRNFSPPWQGRFAEEAAKRGLTDATKDDRKRK